MLREIMIENVAVIEKATVSFSNGFTVLTGETGAGKSILIDSINAIMGNRTSRDIVRSGAAKAAIWATFERIPKPAAEMLENAGYPSDEELLLYREISAEGKSVCRINGMPATAALLREVCGKLIDIHGQHDNQSLLNATKHIELLDAFASNESLLENYRKAYRLLLDTNRQIDALSMDEAEKNRRSDLLAYEIDEINTANLTDGEEEQLSERRNIIMHSRHIMQAMAAAHNALSGSDDNTGAATLVSHAASQIESAAQYAAELSEFAQALNDNYYALSELASDLQSRLSSFEYQDGALDEIEERLDLIYRLKQKYGADIAAVLAYGEKAQLELQQITSSEQQLANLQQLQKQHTLKTQQLAEELSLQRKKAFERLHEKIAKALEFLNMPGIVMSLHCTKVPPGPLGQDDLEFYISTNPGEPPKPLAKIASGGELARIMLALKSALAEKYDMPSVIYDEVDTGISGLAAGRIGRMLRHTASNRQIICVTHTAQVAAYAKSHLRIEKQVSDGRTYTNITNLQQDARVKELARIISGDQLTDISIANAKEMLNMASHSE